MGTEMQAHHELLMTWAEAFVGERPPHLACDYRVCVIGDDFRALDLSKLAASSTSLDLLAFFATEPRKDSAAPVAALAAESYDLALVLPSKQKVESFGLIALALDALKPLGRLAISIPNDLGAKSFDSTLSSLMTGDFESIAKMKSRLLTFTKRDLESTRAEPTQWREALAPRKVAEIGYWSQPGLYGWNKIDDGSQLLLSKIPLDQVTGNGADLGSGYGYLSCELLASAPNISTLHLFEIDERACACAKCNLDERKLLNRAHIWPLDLSKGALSFAGNPQISALKGSLDWVITNPPFHSGKSTDVYLGKSFLGAAWSLLKPQGKLWVVANEFLPYQDHLEKLFGKVSMITREKGFKVFECQTPIHKIL